MNTRITSRDGNVIAADFKPRALPELAITFETQVLYADAAVCLIRVTYRLNGEILGVQHFTAESTTA